MKPQDSHSMIAILYIIFFTFLLSGCGGSGDDSTHSPQLPGKTIGGKGIESGNSVELTADGGFIIAGATNSLGAGGFDVYLLKTDSVGNVIWQKTFGGSGNDYGSSVRQTADGGYIIAGTKGSTGVEGIDVYLIKTDTAGNVIWEKTFGGIGDDIGYEVRKTLDGGYIVAGTCPGGDGEINPEPDAFLLKTDAAGNFSWQKNFGNAQANYWAEGHAVEVTSDGFLLTGTAESLAPDLTFAHDLYLVKTDTSGNMLWEKTIAAPGGQQGNSIIQTADGGFVIVGQADVVVAGNVSIADSYLLKTDSQGIKEWETTCGAGGWDNGYEVRQTTDGGYIFTGLYGDRNGEAYLVKTNAAGTAQWTKTFGGDGADAGHSLRQTPDGGFVIVGSTNSAGAGDIDVYFIKTDANGNVQ